MRSSRLSGLEQDLYGQYFPIRSSRKHYGPKSHGTLSIGYLLTLQKQFLIISPHGYNQFQDYILWSPIFLQNLFLINIVQVIFHKNRLIQSFPESPVTKRSFIVKSNNWWVKQRDLQFFLCFLMDTAYDFLFDFMIHKSKTVAYTTLLLRL